MKPRFLTRATCDACKQSRVRCHMMHTAAGKWLCQTCRKSHPKETIETFNLNGREVTRAEWDNRKR